jgi:hypothetical protein
MIFAFILLVGLLFLLKIKQSLKNKISVIFRIIALIIFAALIIFSKLPHYFQVHSKYYFYILFFVFYLIGIAHVLKPLKLKTYLFFFIGMIGYCIFLYYWSINYSYKKNFDFKGETLTYQYSPFNGSFDKLFKKENGNTNNNQTNEYKEKQAIDFFLFLQCEYYESEQNNTSKEKESIKNGSLKIIHSQAYSKGDPKEFVVKAVKENTSYLNLYKHYTKQSKVQFESIVKYRYEIFTIALE